MSQISDRERRRAFSVWLRTGKLPCVVVADDVEVKFNPWHDPSNGRFTFVGSGQNYGQSGRGEFRGGGGAGGGGGASGRWAGPSQSVIGARQARPRSAPVPTRKTLASPTPSSRRHLNGQLPILQGDRGGGGFGGGGGSLGGAGTSGDWGVALPKQRTLAKAPTNATKVQASGAATAMAENAQTPTLLRRELRNGYEYQIDESGRTRRVSGALKLVGKQARSRTAQAQAGTADRRPTDDGGHYIAARFNGPTDAFNHFAQDANFNRGRYRVLEDQWAKAKRAGSNVTVKIVPRYNSASKRPAVIDIWFKINGHESSVKLANEPKEKYRGK